MSETLTNNPQQARKRQLTGEVLSVVENKTIHVIVRMQKMHPKYKKQYWVSKKYAVHDEMNSAQMHDEVVFQESRPYSKTKKWKLVRIAKKHVI